MTSAPTDTAIEPTPHPENEAERGKSLADLVREHPTAFIAGGVVLGVVIGALFPRKAGSAVTKRALALAATAGELGLAASRHVREGAEKAAHEAKDLLESDAVREKAEQFASAARGAGAKVSDRAAALTSRLKH